MVFMRLGVPQAHGLRFPRIYFFYPNRSDATSRTLRILLSTVLFRQNSRSMRLHDSVRLQVKGGKMPVA
jgi:hypothetical protein